MGKLNCPGYTANIFLCLNFALVIRKLDLDGPRKKWGFFETDRSDLQIVSTTRIYTEPQKPINESASAITHRKFEIRKKI